MKQFWIDKMAKQWQRERSETQMTLGKLINMLEAMSEGAEVANLRSAHSYRGYYVDLAFEKGKGTRTVADLLDECKAAMVKVFTGYKGGYFDMNELTPIWIAKYGCCGLKLMNLYEGGKLETKEDVI